MATKEPGTDYRPGGAPFTGRKFLWVMLGFFGVVIGVNLLMAWFAVTNFRGVVVQSGFVASQDFNRDLARFEAQAARGWQVSADTPDARPTLTVRGPDGAPLTGLTVSARAMWPLDESRDVTLALVETAPGVYASGQKLGPGKWTLQVVIDGEGPRWADALPVFVRQDS